MCLKGKPFAECDKFASKIMLVSTFLENESRTSSSRIWMVVSSVRFAAVKNAAAVTTRFAAGRMRACALCGVGRSPRGGWVNKLSVGEKMNFLDHQHQYSSLAYKRFGQLELVLKDSHPRSHRFRRVGRDGPRRGRT